MTNSLGKFFRNLYLLFTKDFTREEFERLFSHETRGMYDFYVRHMPDLQAERNKFIRFLKVAWHLFLAFLGRLSPARRILYALALLLILTSRSQMDGAEGLYAFVILTFLLALEMAERLIARDELEVAREIQMSLQPTEFDPSASFDVASHSDVAKSVGGDHYDYIRLADGSILVVIADVSGKGISAALYMVKMQTVLQLYCELHCDLPDILSHLNQYLYGHLKRNYFLTLNLLKLYPDGRFEFCRAGHPPVVLVRAEGAEVSRLLPKGTAIGMTPSGAENGSSFELTLELHTDSLRQDDLLFLYTDGVVETVNQAGEEFGESRMEGLLKAFASDPAATIRDRMVNQLSAFRAGTDLRDDTTFVVVKFRGTKG